MKRFMSALLLITAGIATTSAHESIHKGLRITHPWVYETEAEQATLQLKIRNTGKGAERLLRATSPLATSVIILNPLGTATSGLEITGGGELVLKTDGSHLLLSGLKKPLRAYDSFELILVFQKAGEVKIKVMVEERGQPAGG
jgi:copper(I)-binding protein